MAGAATDAAAADRGGTADRGVASPVGGGAVTQAGERRSARVESVRALGALCVAAFHVFAALKGVTLLPGVGGGYDVVGHLLFALGLFSLAVFFALSGYLMFWPFVRERFGGRDAVNLRHYALNRVVRVLPLYYIAIIFLLIVQEEGGTGMQWWAFLTLSENFFTSTAGTVDVPLWSVVTEVHFYVLLPVIALVLARVSGGSLARATLLLLGVSALSIALRADTVLLEAGRNYPLRFSIFTTFFFFVAGMVVCFLRLEWQRSGLPAWLRGPLARADVWLLAAVPFCLILLLDFRLDPLTAPGAFLVVGAVALPLRSGPLLRSLDWKPVAILGLATYSLYVWHAPLIDALVVNIESLRELWRLMAIAMPLTIIAALVSYKLIEEPFLRLRRQWARSSAKQEREPRERRAEPVVAARSTPRT